MRFVPTDRAAKRRAALNKVSEPFPIVRVPSPSAHAGDGDKVNGEAVLMSALPSPRFRGPLFEECVLPQWAAPALIEFEMALRESGLIGEFEVLKQRDKFGCKFRVQKSHISVWNSGQRGDVENGHGQSPSQEPKQTEQRGDQPRSRYAGAIAQASVGHRPNAYALLSAKRVLD